MEGQRPGGRKRETAWRPYAWSTVSEAEVAGPGCHSGRFIYSKSAGEPLKDSAQSKSANGVSIFKDSMADVWRTG